MQIKELASMFFKVKTREYMDFRISSVFSGVMMVECTLLHLSRKHCKQYHTHKTKNKKQNNNNNNNKTKTKDARMQ